MAWILMLAVGCSDDAAFSSDAGASNYSPSGRRDAGAYGDSCASYADGSSSAAPIPKEDYGKWVENDFVETSKEPFSTFSIDVATASYTLMRQDVNHGQLPTPNSVRVEEYVNYFQYAYPQPIAGPFSINMEAAPSRFGKGYNLLRVGLQGLKEKPEERKQANLVFLIDVSGSMSSSNKLPLVKYALQYLVGKLESTDTLGIVTYSNTVKELLKPTTVTNKAAIISAIGSLYASGGTAGGPGIQSAYAMAKSGFINNGINRVILCTDGDFNIGLNGSALIQYLEQKRKEGVTLSALGFGMGNYKDNLLEELSNKGNGNYAYIDSEKEARKVFGERLLSTLQVIAKDVKVQLEFNPKAVFKYRLVGYENRLLDKKDFKDDTKDAGEIGVGHSVTAFYEVEILPGLSPAEVLGTLRFRYKEPQGTVSKELLRRIRFDEVGTDFLKASKDFRFAASVVEFAEILRHSKHSSGAAFNDVKTIAAAASDKEEDRVEFLGLVSSAALLWP